GLFEARFPKLIQLGKKCGIDPRHQPMLIYPTLHYQNGGVVIDRNGQTNVPGLFCIGEASGGVHGRNRLMGNSLLDIISFGRRAGAHAAGRAHDRGHKKISIEHLSNLRRAADTDSVGRAAQTGATLERLFQLAPLANTLERARMPVRIVHNDTKLNNVLFHERSNAALCVVDLDTVMPGLALHDFGDMVRSAATTPDAGRRRLDTGRFEALLGGWLDGLDGLLLEAELDLLASAPQVITYELALRYMTDYLEGNHYFKTRAPGQNLERCRQLLCLLDSMREQAAEMERIAARCRSRGA
ncbi:MAG: hypothetical protein B0D85_05730, partial [Candidatus Sedimenticola endophacoides]